MVKSNYNFNFNPKSNNTEFNISKIINNKNNKAETNLKTRNKNSFCKDSQISPKRPKSSYVMRSSSSTIKSVYNNSGKAGIEIKRRIIKNNVINKITM